MRNLISFMHISLDGYASGPNGEFDWVYYDGEIFKDAIELTDSVDTAIYGRKTYEGMYSYWPTVLTNPESSEDDLHHANWVHNARKIVFSRTLGTVEWHKSTLIQDNVFDEITKLKQQPGQDMMIFGSPTIVHLLSGLGLIDQYRINVSPLILGGGVPYFEGIKPMSALNLIESKRYGNGVLGLRYEVVR